MFDTFDVNHSSQSQGSLFNYSFTRPTIIFLWSNLTIYGGQPILSLLTQFTGIAPLQFGRNFLAIFRLVEAFFCSFAQFHQFHPPSIFQNKKKLKDQLIWMEATSRQQRGKIGRSHTTRFCNSFLFFTGFDFLWDKTLLLSYLGWIYLLVKKCKNVFCPCQASSI